MIVKNEAGNIRRCLESARSLCDAVAIVDTGSTDGTQDIIREVEPTALLKEHPWVDFPTNRNQSLALAKTTGCDYILILDGDDELVDRPDGWGILTADLYYLHYAGELDLAQPRLIRAALPWSWHGKSHNELKCFDYEGQLSADHLYRPLIEHHGWERHDKKRIASDLVKMRGMLEDEPTPRLIFNLARTLDALGRTDESLYLYKRRAALSIEDEDEEQWFAQFRYGDLLMGESFNDGAEALLEAWRMRPWRNEPLRKLAIHCENVADRTPYPYGDILFIRRKSYDNTVEWPAGASL